MKTVLALLAFSLAPQAFAAPASGSGSGIRGGGKGIVCRDSAGKPTSVELLDLWESRALYNRPATPSQAPLGTQVQEALWNLKDADAFTFSDEKYNKESAIRDFDAYLGRAEHFLQAPGNEAPIKIQRLRGSTIALTDDSFEEAWPAGCKVEQIVAYKQWNTGAIVYVNQDLFEAMDTVNQAALIVHEAVYSSFKFREETNSVRIRRAVGYAFSGGSFARQPVAGLRHISCESKKMAQVNVSLFQDPASGKLETFTHRDVYRMSFGFFPAPAIAMMNSEPTLENVLDPEQCQRMSNFNQAYVLLGGAGPADFDRNNMLVLTCQEGALTVRYSSSGYPQGDLSDYPELSCKLVEEKR